MRNNKQGYVLLIERKDNQLKEVDDLWCKLTRLYIVFISTAVIFTISCKGRENIDETKASTLGNTEIWCDKSIEKIVSQEEEVFESAYKYANLDIKFDSESKIMKRFYEDSTDVIIVSHALDSLELKKFNSRKIYPRQYQFAVSAIAFVVNKNSPKTNFTYDEIIGLLVSDEAKNTIVIEGEGSGIANELLKHTREHKFGKNVYSRKSKEDVISWVLDNPSAIGAIDWSDISDSDDSKAKELLAKINLVGISSKVTKGEFVTPYQYNLNGLYAFTRDLYMIRRLGQNDVSLGFASFVCSERGQKIVLKAGLLPKYQSERWVEFGDLKDIEVTK